VWQPMELLDGKAFTRDINLHSIHRLDSGAFKGFIGALRALKAGDASPAEALAPHPVMESEGAEGPYFTGLMALLKNNIGIKNLHRVAFFADSNPNAFGHWVMLAFDVIDGQIVLSPSPMLGKQKGETQKRVQRIEGAPNRLGEPLPRGDFAHNLFPVLAEVPAANESEMLNLVRRFLMTKYESALALENPNVHEPANADCASCHMATLEKSKLKVELLAMGATLGGDAFQAPGWNLSSRDEVEFGSTSLQIFSFFKHRAKIGTRVVHDAVLSAERINAMTDLD